MLVDVLWANLAVFAVGQLVAVGYLRTGRFWLGMAATVALWVTLDWWLVGRLVFALDAAALRAPVLGLQLTALGVAFAWGWARLRRRRALPTRAARYRTGMQQLLTGDDAAATQTFRALTWSDPWDAAAWAGLGDALRGSGDTRRAGRAYRRAEAVDVGGALTDLLGHRRALLQSPGKSAAASRPAAVVPAAVVPAAGEPAAVEPAAGEPAADQPAAVSPAAVTPVPVAPVDVPPAAGAGPSAATGAVQPGPKPAAVAPAAKRGARKEAR